MRNTIFIKWNELQQQINLKNFYMGESAKRKDADADTIQSSTDDKEVRKARLKILQLSEEVTEMEDFFQLDILISEILEKNS